MFVIPICTIALKGAFAVSVYATTVNDKPDSKLATSAIDVADEQISVRVDYREVISKQYESFGKALTNEQLQKLDELYHSQAADPGWEKLAYQEGIITGEVDPNAPRLDLTTARKIISEHNDFDEILSEFDKIQYPDYIGGSGHTVVRYRLDDFGSEIVIFPIEKQIFYSKDNSDSTEKYSEILFE